MKITYGLLGILALVPVVSPLPARADAAPQAVISEVNWAGSEASTADEWLELTNLGTTPIDLTGWVILGGAGAGSPLPLPNGATLPAQGTYLIANYPLGDLKTTLNVKPDLVTTAVSLANSSLTLALTAPDGTVVDEFSTGSKPAYGSTAPYASAERNLTTREWQTGTPSSPGVVELPTLTLAAAVDEPPVATLTEGAGVAALETTPPTPSVPLEGGRSEPPLTTPTGGGVNEPPLTDSTGEEVSDPPLTTSEPVDEASLVPTQTPVSVTEAVVDPIAVPVTTLMEGAGVPALETTPLAPSLAGGGVSEPIAYPAHSVIINEFVSDPADGTEWIEVVNTTDETIDLTGWTEKDGSTSKTAFPSQMLEPHTFFVLQNPKGKLNNDGDSIFLSDSTGATVDAISYDKSSAPSKGKSLARTEVGAWKETDPTPLTKNTWVDAWVDPNLTTYETTNDTSTAIGDTESDPGTNQGTDNAARTASAVRVERDLAVETSVGAASTRLSTTPLPPPLQEGEKASHPSVREAVPVIDASEITNFAANATVTVEGVLIAAPGTFGKQLAYIDGLEIYFNKADWPKLLPMTRVKVTGTVDIKTDYTRLKVIKRSNIKIIGEDSIAPDALETLDDARHGLLMSLSGSVTDISGKNLTIDLENGDSITAVSAKDATIDFSTLAYGDRIAVTGMVRLVKGTWTLTIMNQTGLTTLQDGSTQGSTPTADARSSTRPITSPLPPPLKGGGAIKTPTKSVPWVGGGLLTTSLGALGYWFAKAKGITLPFITQS